ncbi:Peptidase propeptide and YPEB domain [Kingella potus]|uniref:Peptidase propeptide and YPEB domain n=2 Tax=Kingella potus TaxID=265175 RepID=A0A377R3U8_9NEIS|nr:Peptidase propeptide and YPEB domain [Kingella potus]
MKAPNIFKRNPKFIAAVLAAACAGSAFAGPSQTCPGAPAAPCEAYSADAAPAGKQAAFAQAKISAAQAVDYAAAKTKGQPVEVDFRYKHGRSYYKVEIADGTAQQEVFVDAATGSIIDSRPDYDSKPRRPVPNVAVSLKQAIAAAEAETGGKAKDAELKYKRGRPVYEVETVNGAQKHEVRVNAADGKIISSHLDL